MNARTAAWLAAAGLAGAARGQVITTPGITARLDLTWQEDPAFAHNDNGSLEPGEHALMLMSLSFTGQYTVASFTPPVGVFSSGTILGFGVTPLDIRSSSPDPSGLYNGGITQWPSTSPGPNANDDGTTGYGVRGGWRLGGNAANGQPASPGSWGFVNMVPGQLPANPATANTTQPIERLVRLGWQPNSYANRTVTFSVGFAMGGGPWNLGLYLDYDGQSGGIAYLDNTRIMFGSVNIPIAPSSAGSTLLIGAAAWVHGGRRRSRSLTRPAVSLPHVPRDRPCPDRR